MLFDRNKKTWKKYLKVYSWEKTTSFPFGFIDMFILQALIIIILIYYSFSVTYLSDITTIVLLYVLIIIFFIFSILDIALEITFKKGTCRTILNLVIQAPAFFFLKRELGFYFSTNSLKKEKSGEEQKRKIHYYLCKNIADHVRFWNMYNLIEILYPSILLDGKSIFNDYNLLKKLLVSGYQIPIPDGTNKETKIPEYQVSDYFSSFKINKIISLQKDLFMQVQSRLKIEKEITSKTLRNLEEYKNYLWNHKTFLYIFEKERPSMYKDIKKLKFNLLEEDYHIDSFLLAAKNIRLEKEEFENFATIK